MTKSAAVLDSPYAVHPGVAMLQKLEAELKDKTGRTLDEWVTLVRKKGPKDENARREWLKTKHELGTSSASWIAERAEGKVRVDSDPDEYRKAAVEYVNAQYSGAKANLRPIYQAVLNAAATLGSNVNACPCKTIVPLYRNHVFAQIKPSTNTRIDLGFALAKHKGKLPKRLIDTGGLAKKDRITHRIELKSVSEIDDEVRSWLKTAYDLDS